MNKTQLVCLVLACVLLFCGCGNTAYPGATTLPIPSESITEFPTTEPTTVPVITEPEVMGFTLEDLAYSQGVFYILEDGSFANYYSDGFKKYAGIYDGNQDTLYISKATVDSNPVLSQDDTIAIFYDQNIYVDISPIAVSGATVSLTLDDEFVILNPRNSSIPYDGITYYPAFYGDNHDEVSISVINSTEDYLFGVPMKEVEYTRYFKRYDDIFQEQYMFEAFPENTELTFSIVEGTKVRQVTKEADYYYYIYGDYYTSYNPNLPWADVTVVPTINGYAAVSLENVPAGQYVMIISTADNRYWGTILHVE